MQNPWTTAMPKDQKLALPTANQELFVHNRISTPWSHIEQVQKKKEILQNNRYIYDANNEPITATVAPSDANIVSRFSNAYTGTGISDRESIIDINSTKRLTSVYEQPYLRGEKRDLVTTTRNDKVLPDTLMHESKFPHTGYHNTESHPEVRFDDTKTPSFRPPVAISYSHNRKHSRLMNVRLNTHENPEMNRGIQMPNQSHERNEMVYTQTPQFPSNLPEPTRVQSESSLQDPKVNMPSDNAPSFGVRVQNQYADKVQQRELNLNLRQDSMAINHKAIQPAQRSMGYMGKVIHSDIPLSYTDMHKPDRSEYTQIQLRPNEILRDDDMQYLPPRMQKRGSKHSVQSQVFVNPEIELDPQPQFFQTGLKAQGITGDVTLREEDLLDVIPALPRMQSMHSKQIENFTHKDDMSHELQSKHLSHHKQHALRDQSLTSKKISDMQVPVAPQFKTKHSRNTGAFKSSKNGILSSQPAMNLVSFVKGIFTGSKTHITKEPTKLNSPAQPNPFKGPMSAPMTQVPQKITLDKLRLNAGALGCKEPSRQQALSSICTGKEGHVGRMPLGNRSL